MQIAFAVIAGVLFIAAFVCMHFADRHLASARGCLSDAQAALDAAGRALDEAKRVNEKAVLIATGRAPAA